MGDDIPLDKAELLGIILETILYGFSLPMFGATIWALIPQRSTQRINRKMIMVAFALLLVSTTHVVIHIIRIMESFILFGGSYPGGINGYLSDGSQWTIVSMNFMYTAQTLIGDGVILYRCYVVWQSKLIMIIPVLLWCAVVVTGIGSSSQFTFKQIEISMFEGTTVVWIASFFASTLASNLLTTLLLASRIWYVDKEISKLCTYRSQLRPVIYIIMDAGVIYSVALLAAVITFAKQTNGQYVVVDIIPSIISITFYMVLIRVGLANRSNKESNETSLDYTTVAGRNNPTGQRSSRIQIESMVMVSLSSKSANRSRSKLEVAEEVV